MKMSSIVLKPIITEKGLTHVNNNEYIFKVNMKANKYNVAKEIQRIYSVEVTDVRTSVIPGKKKRIIGTRMRVKTPRWKKAVVRVKEGQKIDLFPKE